MNITLYLADKIVNFKLPMIVSGSFSFDANDNEESKLINIEANENEWILYQTQDVTIIQNSGYTSRIKLIPNTFYVLRRDETNYLIYVTTLSTRCFTTYKFSTDINVLIGNNNEANICYPEASINNFTKITYQNNSLYLENISNNFVYINKKRLTTNSYKIISGDQIELYGIKMIFLAGMLLIYNNDNKLFINEVSAKLTAIFLPILEEAQDVEIKDTELYDKEDYFSKAPRLRRIIKTKEMKLSAPPNDSTNGELPLLLVIGPMLTMGAMSATTLIDTISKIQRKTLALSDAWPQLLTTITMLTSTIAWPLITQFYNKYIKRRKQKEMIKQYTNYLDEKRQEIEEEAIIQKNILLENLITVSECLNIIYNKNVNFWDKRLDQSDFLIARIGIGNEKLDAKISYTEEEFTIDKSILRKMADKLVDDFKYIENVPIGYSFFENKITAIMGVREKSIQFMHNILAQFLAFYSYDDLRIVTFTEHNSHNFDYLKYLNHSFNNERSFRFFASDNESIKRVSEYMQIEMNNRMLQAENNNKIFKPHYLIIIDNYDEVKRQDFLKELTEFDGDIGFSIIIIESKLSNLPSKCNNFISLEADTSCVLKKSYENQEQIFFKDEIIYNLDMMKISKIVSNVPIELEEVSAHLPTSLTFMEMEKVGKVEQLNVLNRWNTNDATTTLKAEVGVDEQGELMYLDLHEKFHGPHGLIAGMTGSGKSEFIITYILSMAINYSPDDVSFILIDYKGGGLAGAFENKTAGIILPHLSGTITNLDKAEMDRTLVSIDSEIKRRQNIFNTARDKMGESTIDIYKYQKFYKEGKLDEAVPHLFIICDEFAELKSQQPEFMDNLISVARIGRSLGVHLILATQKPSGVVNDQIWSNTKFRVCLKVQDESDSKEMLKRPEAASLKQTGRFYLQVGYDEYFALGQSAWCGANYYPADKIIKQVNKSVDIIEDSGMIIKSIQASNGIKISPQGEQISSIMKIIIDIANKVGKRAKKLWLDNIPEIILESELIKKYNYITTSFNIAAIIGEYDAPEKQEQGLVKYNYLEDGNTIVYGMDGSERDKLLDTLVYSTVSKHLSSEINYYIIDFGSESLRKFISLPHIGGIVFAGEDDKLYNLLKIIKEEITKRKKLFVDYGGEYINYIKTSKETLPIKTIIINNYDSLYESYPTIYDELPELVRDSERYGIIFIFTCNAINSIQSKISQNCNNIYAFKLKDSSDYTSLFGAKSKIVPRNIDGRGIFKDEEPHEFQTASIISDKEKLGEYIIAFCKEQIQINQPRAKRIPVLPEIVTFEEISQDITTIKAVPVAISKNELESYKIDLLTNAGYIITSNRIANTKKFVKSLLYVLKNINNTSLIIIDAVKNLSLLREEFTNSYTEDFDKVLDMLINYIDSLHTSNSNQEGVIIINGINKLITKVENQTKINDLLKKIKLYEKIAIIIIDDYQSIRKYNFEEWFTSNFNLNDGIWIGKGISDQNLLHLTNITREMTKEYKNDMGYIVSEGSATLCKFINFIEKQGDDSNGK